MPLTPNQPRTGHLQEESKNPTKRTGRADATEGQKTTGHKTERDYPTGSNPDKAARPFRRSPSNRGEDLAAQEAMAEVSRADSVHQLGESE
jgi:hypothetical protein